MFKLRVYLYSYNTNSILYRIIHYENDGYYSAYNQISHAHKTPSHALETEIDDIKDNIYQFHLEWMRAGND